MEEIHTDSAPDAIAPYSQGTVADNTVYVSGQGPTDPETRELKAEEVREQTEQVLENIKAILEEAGTSLDNVVDATVYLANMENYDIVNEVYSEYMSKPYPARAAVEVSALPGEDYHLEIRVTAVIS